MNERDQALTRAAAAEVIDNERGTVPREMRGHLHTQSDEDRAATLYKLISPILGKRLNRASLHKIDTIVQRYAEFLARHGIGFPQLRAVLFLRRGHVELVRADLEDAGIQQVVRNAITRFPDIGAKELVDAVRGAFPDYMPTQVAGQLHEERLKAQVRSNEDV